MLGAMTLGRGAVPVVPAEIRRLIIEWTYPRDVAACAVCKRVVLLLAGDGRLEQRQAFTYRFNECRCMSCLWLPPAPTDDSPWRQLLRRVRLGVTPPWRGSGARASPLRTRR